MSGQFSSGGQTPLSRAGVPRYLQIAQALRDRLRGDGERIPSEHQLCAEFKVSRPTVRQALDLLVQEGRIYRHAGRGTFSTPSAGGDDRLRVIGSVGDMMALGDETWFKLIAREMVRLPANIAQALKLPPGSSGYRITGVRHADQGPFQHVTAYVLPSLAGALAHEDLSKTSVIALIERQLGIRITALEQVVDAVFAPRHVAELLNVRPRTPLLVFERTYRSTSGGPVEHAVTYQIGRRYPFRMVLARADRRG
ncbi:MAG: GntR family transcriptional regulator [Candidatus Rokubacteria bacterium]|nr:GntR family transcriptional regulator [Candidatus Rokubacteria bacterium]MBI3825793.1 GntR family transcriptional regulator [Candidatus Rokubacteria bacterium]